MPTSLKQDKITGVVFKHPFAITAVLVLVTLIATGMQIRSNPVTCAIMVLGYLLALGYGFSLKKTKKLTTEALIVLIFALGFILKLGYVLYSDILTRQNDVAIFDLLCYGKVLATRKVLHKVAPKLLISSIRLSDI